MPYAYPQSQRPRLPMNPGPGTCRRPAPPVVRRVLHRINGGPSQRRTTGPAPCLHPTGGLRRVPAPILHGGPQIPGEVPGRQQPPRQRRPPSRPNPLGPALSHSRLLAGMKTIVHPRAKWPCLRPAGLSNWTPVILASFPWQLEFRGSRI